MANRNFSIAHDVSRVFKCLTNPDYILARSKAMGELDASCKIARDGDRTSLHITRTVCHEADKLPKLMRRFGLRQTVVIDEQWWDDGEGKAKEKVIDEDMIPTSLDELKKLKALKAKEIDVDALFGDSAIRE